MAVSGGHSGKIEAEKISKMIIAEQQKALDDIKNIEDKTTELRAESAAWDGLFQIPGWYVTSRILGGIQGAAEGRYAVNNVVGLTNLTNMEKAKMIASITQAGAKSAAQASLRTPIPYTLAAAEFLYRNVNPETAQVSMDTTDANIDTQELYQ